MARMLQALKNLESKVVRAPAAAKAAVQSVQEVEQKHETEPVNAVAAAADSLPAVEAVIPRAVEVVDRLNDFLAGELADVSPGPVSVDSEGNKFGFTDFAFFGQRAGDRAALPAIPFESQPASLGPARMGAGEFLGESVPFASIGTGKTPVAPNRTGGMPVAPNTTDGTSVAINRTVEKPVAFSTGKMPVPPNRTPCELERQVRWMLNDPVRSQPVVELVDRLCRDIEQISGKVVAFVTVGSEGSLPGPLLPVAVLLAEQYGKQALLVDGDTARCRLSEGLQCGQKSGLAELLNGGAASMDCCVPTATSGLSFLPAGQLRHYDASTAGAVLEKSLQDLTNEHGCVLIDVGTAGSPNAAALARQADATYLVVELGAVETVAARKSLNDLRATGARVLGCIAV